MKTKENLETKNLSFDKARKPKQKPSSLRPMNSMVKVQSFKPKTNTTAFVMKDLVDSKQD